MWTKYSKPEKVLWSIHLYIYRQYICISDLACGASVYDPPVEAAAAAAKLLQSCPTLCDPIDGSPPGSPVPGILQARTLEWIAISSSTVEATTWLKVSSEKNTAHALLREATRWRAVHCISQDWETSRGWNPTSDFFFQVRGGGWRRGGGGGKVEKWD